MKLPMYLKSKIPGVIIIALVVLIVFFQWKHDQASPPFSIKLKAVTRDLLPSDIVPHITFGFTHFIADLYWIRAVQDFTVWDGQDIYYLNYFKNIAALDPTFEYPYLFNILIVPRNKDIIMLHAVAEIAAKGIEAIPNSWKIPFYLATQYYIFTKSYQPTEHYLSIAAAIKGAPDGVYLNYATFVAKKVPQPIRTAEDYVTAMNLVKVIYNNTDNETIKKMTRKGLEEHAINQMLQKGIVAYVEKYKRYPKTVEEMRVVNFISLPQELLNNFDIEISAKDGSYKVTEK